MANTPEKPTASASDLRRMCRQSHAAVLATTAIGHKQVGDGWPVASMVVPATDLDGAPILLISELADHTRHLKADARLSLLFSGSDNPSNATSQIQTDTARLTLFGRAIPDTSAAVRNRYLLAHPDAAQYADFADFGFYRVDVEAAYWVGGFGKQRRLTGKQFLIDDCDALKEGHDQIINHMNADHLDAIADIVAYETDHASDLDWKMISIDCDGMVLGTDLPESPNIRIEFPHPVHAPTDARQILVEMCKKSRDLKA
ncbi:HugZ family protein [Thalassospira lucentensis]|uniref:HugZ family pyridoxamine 5'-phosphate oxidase n=1 Tax=Thalassospira lucentensis TaxID=168935 RepID=UPI00142D7E0E|nr:DUF2470 domain-containing protein [Thalassospira lucentensis]NIZ01045.1 DUF2470 domain-containing protein [Thalassospira lucentensis]